jgi:penicillin-binding protein 2
VYFYQLGLQVGVDRLAYFARGFGLGLETGIDLPGEKRGLVPTTAWKEQERREPWILGETVSTSIGQGYNLVTPLQLAVAFAAIANGGTRYAPRVVLRLEDRDGQIVDEPPVREQGVAPVDAVHLATLRTALARVVNEPRGTGGRARLPDVVVAGKTGTSQVVRLEHLEGLDDDEIPMRDRDHAWFAAFAPAEKAEIVVVALLEHGGSGGRDAAPVARAVLSRWAEKRREREASALAAAPPAAAEERRAVD